MFASDFNSNHIVKPMNKKRDREFSSLRRMRKNVFREHARRQLVVESLEDRRLLTVGFLPAPDWVEQGPSAVSNGQVTVPPSNQINGAAETIAFNPITRTMLTLAP